MHQKTAVLCCCALLCCAPLCCAAAVNTYRITDQILTDPRDSQVVTDRHRVRKQFCQAELRNQWECPGARFLPARENQNSLPPLLF